MRILKTLKYYGCFRRHLFAYYRYPTLVIFTVLFLTIGMYVWPLWTGDVFRLGNKSLATKVPNEYFELNEFLNKDAAFFRILHLPIVYQGENYTWEKGYVGSEPSVNLLDKPSVSRMFSAVPFYEELIKPVNRLVMMPGFEKILSLLSIKYIVVHHDINPEAHYLNTPSFYKKYLTCKIEPAASLLHIDDQKGVICISTGGEIKGWKVLLGKSNFSENRSKEEPFSFIRYRDTLSNAEFHFRYMVDQNKSNWSGMDFFRVHLRTNLPTTIKIAAYDGINNILAFWDGRYEPIYSIRPYEVGQWKEFVLPFQSSSSWEKGDVDLRQVEYFNLEIPVLDKVGEIELDIGPMYLEKAKTSPNAFVSYRKKFESLDLYEVKEDILLPHIYPVQRFVWFNDFNHFVNTLSEERFQLNEELILFEFQKEEFPFLEKLSLMKEASDPPVLNVKKINPTHYIVDVKSASTPFFLVFHELYHPGWEGMIGDEPQPHFRGNIYGNVWHITKNGNYTIELQFIQQKSFEKYLKISGIFIMVFTSGIFLYYVVSKICIKCKS
jgi:hypothetical protein